MSLLAKQENKKVVVLSGAGMSAESGIDTFRDKNGLWEGHDVMEVASLHGWHNNPTLVLDFYNQRRRQLHQVEPNKGHLALAALEKNYDVTIVTQNVDNLHERAGSSNIIHLHGELLKSQSTQNPLFVYECLGDIVIGDKCELGSQLRPFIVWFGEAVPLLEQAAEYLMSADIIIVVGTSMSVYPAAGLTLYAQNDTQIFYIDPKPSINEALRQAPLLKVIEQTAAKGLPELVDYLMKQNNHN